MKAKSGVRQQKAQETRRRMLDGALRLFIANGYDGTTIDSIAREAKVAVQTIYFSFGNKQTILKELVDVRVAGDDEPIPTLERRWVRDAVTAESPEAQLRHQVAGAREIYERVGELLEVLRNAAASNEDVAPLWERNKRQRLEVQRHLVKALADKHPLPGSLTLDRAVDISYGLLGPEMYHLLVTERGWTSQQWADWVHSALYHHLVGGS
ncbi:TetR/AcrR family transcriptional regulator [Streptomyces sp. TRM 70361]|uniref:TetR/AcrR family transcriptional regulator n=1 Tax=Streptomyces sp. TRM 70361 TaxID=3116553 RepID=UPI002E7B9ACD|nr:TetR/AcrR family transcriptional regulator [Streptomyces sp. TRM 70361]MEE1938037.1 TetR/AcrR family transcriptional regulator [Streptomyces sp. TRM 70361]